MADDLSLNGKNLISASRASKELSYNSDYIGQLARKKKIPAKLVGRTWFVDIDALKAHKEKSEQSRKEKAKNNFVNTSYLGQTSIESEPKKDIYVKKPFAYESEIQPLLPKISKTAPEPVRTIDLSYEKIQPVSFGRKHVEALSFSKPNRKLIVTFIALFSGVVVFALASNQAFGIARDLASALGSFKNTLMATVSNMSTSSDATTTAQGVVVFSDNSNQSDKVSQIKNNFSDDVTVIFDKDGESGIVRPVFRSGTDSNNYAFVLVPLNKK